MNGDVLTDLDITALVAFHRARGAEGTHRPHSGRRPVSASAWCRPTATGRVTAFIEKPPRDEAPDEPDQRRHLRASSHRSSAASRRTRASRSSGRPFPPWWRDGALFARVRDAYWLDTGTPDAYLQAHRDLLIGRPARAARARRRARSRRRGRRLAHRRGGRPEPTRGAVAARRGCVRRRRRRASRTRWSAPARSIEEGATVSDSVLLPGARVAAKAPRSSGSIVGPDAIVGQRCVMSGGVGDRGRCGRSPPGRSVDGERVAG